jgi:large subunit ribosomal protein L6
MSRIGKKPVSIPAGVEVAVSSDNKNIIVFKKGKLSQELDTRGNVSFVIENGTLTFNTLSDEREHRAYWGTYRSLSENIITGLTTGFEKKLEINGTGYRAMVKGKILELHLGFSHKIDFPIADGLTIAVEKNLISIKGADKQQVGQVASQIRSFRPPEPYKGKGVKYVEERIIRKAGKTAKK